MKLKSYFASSVEAAMALARQELGPEAMLVSSQRTTPENRHYGDYEVVFALMAQDASPAQAQATPPEPQDREADGVRQLAAQIADVRQQLDRMATSFARARASSAFRGARTDASALLSQLLDAEVDEDTAEAIALRAAQFPSPESALPVVLGEMIRFNSTLGKPGRPRRVIALVGPPGSGKTTTLVKLAARFGVGTRRPTQILSTDCYRFAAAEQLRSYAAILGVGFQAVETAHALSIALDEHRHKDLVLIDTPGLSERDMAEALDLAPLLASHPDVDVHLVAPASMRQRDLTRAIKRYESFGAGKILFTKLDETDSPGAVVSHAFLTGLPISFFTTGQQIPEDLEPAALETLTGLLTRAITAGGLAAAARH